MKLFINSLPKSGTHLTIKLVEELGFNFSNVNLSSTSLFGRHQIAKSILRGSYFGQPCIEVGLDIAACVRKSWIEYSLQSTKIQTYSSGHSPYSDALYKILVKNNYKIIHIIRDPRDVLLSWAHYVPTIKYHYGYHGLKDLPLEDRIQLILHGYESNNFSLESFPNILQRSLEWINKEDILIVKFEELVGPKGGGSEEHQISKIKEIAGFVDSKNNNFEDISTSLFGGTKVFRKGKIGSWKDELSVELIDEINSTIKPFIEQFGYQL